MHSALDLVETQCARKVVQINATISTLKMESDSGTTGRAILFLSVQSNFGCVPLGAATETVVRCPGLDRVP
jgi:hypothetical protein